MKNSSPSNRFGVLLLSLSVFFLLLIIFIGANFEIWKGYTLTPRGTEYSGATGFYFDYYQFLSWIRDGSQGQILLSSRYIPTKEPAVLIHTFFPLIGYVLAPLQLDPGIIYHLMRNVFLAVFLFCLYRISKHALKTKRASIMGFLFILLGSGFTVFKSGFDLRPAIEFWREFYTFEKFIISPHHLLSLSMALIIFILMEKIERMQELKIHYFLLIIPAALTAVIANPAIMSFFLLGLFFTNLWNGLEDFILKIRKRKTNYYLLKTSIVIVLLVAPLYLYLYYVFGNIAPWKNYYEGERVGRYAVSFSSYILSLGPLFIVSLFSIKYVKKFHFLHKFMYLWLVMPPLIFPFAGRQIPFSMSRIFSLVLYIPSGIMSVFFLRYFKPTYIINKAFRTGLIIFISVFLSFSLYLSLNNVFFSYRLPNYYNVFIPRSLIAAFEYINIGSRTDSVVLAGENISNLIPAYTNNRAVLGRLDAYDDYWSVYDEVNNIYLGNFGREDLKKKLNKWNVQFLIFGIDQISYEDFYLKDESFFKKIFEEENVVVAEYVDGL